MCIGLIVHRHGLTYICVCVHMATTNEEVRSPLGPSWGQLLSGIRQSAVSCYWQTWMQRRWMRAVRPVTIVVSRCLLRCSAGYNCYKALGKGQSIFCPGQRQGTSPLVKRLFGDTSGESLPLPDEPQCETLTRDNAGLSPAKELLYYPINVSTTAPNGGNATEMKLSKKDIQVDKKSKQQALFLVNITIQRLQLQEPETWLDWWTGNVGLPWCSLAHSSSFIFLLCVICWHSSAWRDDRVTQREGELKRI